MPTEKMFTRNTLLSGCALGILLFLILPIGLSRTDLLSPTPDNAALIQMDRIVFLVAMICGLGICMLARTRLHSLNRLRTVLVFSIILESGVLLSSGFAIELTPLNLLYPGLILQGFSCAFLFLVWAEVFKSLGVRLSGVVAISSIVTVVLLKTALSTTFPLFPLQSAFACATLPLIYFLANLYIFKNITITSSDVGPKGTGRDALPQRQMLRSLGNFFFYGTVTGVSASLVSTLPFSGLEAVPGLIVLVFLLIYMFFRKKLKAVFLSQVLLLYMFLSLLALPALTPTYPMVMAALLACMIGVMLTVTIMFCVDMSNLLKIPAQPVVAQLALAVALGLLTGIALIPHDITLLTADSQLLSYLTFFLVFTLAAINILLPMESNGQQFWGLLTVSNTENREEFLSRRCQELKSIHSLTSREVEILYLLARGASKEYLAKTFTISPGTARIHVQNIYRKLDVHSAQELSNYVEQREPSLA